VKFVRGRTKRESDAPAIMDWDAASQDSRIAILLRKVASLETSNAELRDAVILAGKRIRVLGGTNDPLLEKLRELLGVKAKKS
jgi:hypothetical protein